MTRQILTIFKDVNLYQTVRDALQRHLANGSHDVIVDWARTDVEARRLAKARNYDLVITHLHIPLDEETPLRENEERGLLFLRALQEEYHKHIPSIVVSVSGHRRLDMAIGQLNNCAMVIEGGKRWEDDLIASSRDALASSGSKKLWKRVNLDITLKLGEMRAECSLKGSGLPCETTTTFGMNADHIRKLIARSKHLDQIKEWPAWKEAMGFVGEELMEEIFIKDPEFFRQFTKLRAQVGGIENFRIRFVVEKDIHPMALEALVEKNRETGKQDYWMLRTPIYRRLNVYANTYPLFADEETQSGFINVLIIESDVEGYVKGLDISLEKLQNVGDEADWLENYLHENKKNFLISKIQRIKRPPDGKKSLEYVEETFRDGTWHVVHYAGHSYYDGAQGYVFFPEDRYIERLPVEKLGNWLRLAKVKFVYLSSCYSSKADFVFELAAKQIPSIVGFRWDIVDPEALEHAKMFYKHLFDMRSLEYAFLRTRKDMHDRNEDHRIWAAPMLIMQVGD